MPQARRKIAALALAVGLGLTASAATAHARARRRPQAPSARVVAARAPDSPAARATARPAAAGPGHVLFVTDKRAYLDAGSRDGLAPRQSLAISRGGRAAGACTVETVAEHQTTCVGARLRVGDTFRAPGRREAKKTAPPALPPLVDDDTLTSRAEALADAPQEKVDFDGRASAHARGAVSVSPGFAVWRGQPSDAGTYSQERIDAAIRGMPLGAGLRFDAAFSAIRWQQPALERFRPGEPTQFYLWQAEVNRREMDARTVFSLGRIWPWHAPGLTGLDGFQLGRRNADQTAEAGAYAGFVPTATSLAPQIDAWAAGLYGALAQAGAKSALLRAAREELRAGAWHTPETGTVAEAEGLAQIWVGGVSLGGTGRAAYASAFDRRPVLERATFDLASRPTLAFGGGLHVRYFGESLPDGAVLRDEVPALAGSAHGLADLRWDPRPWVGLATYAGADRDAATGRHLLHAGAELRLPRLLGDFGGVWLGGAGEDGWLRGFTGYGQLVGRFRARVQLLARASLGATEFETPTAAPNLWELGGYVHLDGALSSWLRLRAWSLLRAPFLVQGEPAVDASPSFTAGSSLTGTF
jgi:hypothetical protein